MVYTCFSFYTQHEVRELRELETYIYKTIKLQKKVLNVKMA